MTGDTHLLLGFAAHASATKAFTADQAVSARHLTTLYDLTRREIFKILDSLNISRLGNHTFIHHGFLRPEPNWTVNGWAQTNVQWIDLGRRAANDATLPTDALTVPVLPPWTCDEETKARWSKIGRGQDWVKVEKD